MRELTLEEVEDVSGGLVVLAAVMGGAALFLGAVAAGMSVSAADGGSCKAPD